MLELLGSRVYCVLGDGEIQEGQVWEAAMSAPKPTEAIAAIREILGVPEPAWAEHLVRDAATRAIADELRALERR